jgi:hypothetical protein
VTTGGCDHQGTFRLQLATYQAEGVFGELRLGRRAMLHRLEFQVSSQHAADLQ